MNNQTLFAKSSKDKWKIWKASTDYKVLEGKGISIVIQWGYEDGKQQEKVVYVKEGKNKGKSNETSITQQVDLKLGQLYQKQFDDDYSPSKDTYTKSSKAMLAQKYKDKKHLIDWNSNNNWASKKLNGIRCNVHCESGKLKFTSREYKGFKYLTHLETDIRLLLDSDSFSCMFDGELFHPDIPFEILSSLINNDSYCEVLDPDTGITWKTEDVQYHIYDYVNYSHLADNYFDRFIDYKGLLIASASSSLLYIVSNVQVKNEEELKNLATEWIVLGYEGLMLRHGNSAYEFNKRSSFLLKYKVMEQDEFKILKIYLAENDPTKVQIVCENHFNLADEAYNTFDVGSVKGNKQDNLIKYYDNRDSLVGKYLTIDYQVLSKYKVPLFPVGIDLRVGSIVDGVFTPDA
jgi:hypothetical protein